MRYKNGCNSYTVNAFSLKSLELKLLKLSYRPSMFKQMCRNPKREQIQVPGAFSFPFIVCIPSSIDQWLLSEFWLQAGKQVCVESKEEHVPTCLIFSYQCGILLVFFLFYMKFLKSTLKNAWIYLATPEEAVIGQQPDWIYNSSQFGYIHSHRFKLWEYLKLPGCMPQPPFSLLTMLPVLGVFTYLPSSSTPRLYSHYSSCAKLLLSKLQLEY